MKKIFIFLSMFLVAFCLNAQKTLLIADFDEVMPDINYWSSDGGTEYEIVEATGDAEGMMCKIMITNSGGDTGGFGIITAEPFNPRDYEGLQFLCFSESTNIPIVTKLEQTYANNDGDLGTRIQLWDNSTNVYNTPGNWQICRISFARHLESLDSKQSMGAKIDEDAYDQVVLSFAPWSNRGDFNLFIDNVYLGYPPTTGINLINGDSSIKIAIIDGRVLARSVDGIVNLELYSIAGEKLATAQNEISVSNKGIYIVKATNSNSSVVAKVLVK